MLELEMLLIRILQKPLNIKFHTQNCSEENQKIDGKFIELNKNDHLNQQSMQNKKQEKKELKCI